MLGIADDLEVGGLFVLQVPEELICCIKSRWVRCYLLLVAWFKSHMFQEFGHRRELVCASFSMNSSFDAGQESE